MYKFCQLYFLHKFSALAQGLTYSKNLFQAKEAEAITLQANRTQPGNINFYICHLVRVWFLDPYKVTNVQLILLLKS